MNEQTLQSEDFAAILENIPDFYNEVNILKSVCQNSFKNNEPFVPMYIFYNSSREKSYLIIPPYDEGAEEQDPYLEKHSTICHAFSSLAAKTLLILECGNIKINDEQYSALKFFVVTPYVAFIYILPFELDEDRDVSWLHSEELIQEVMKVDSIDKTKDFVNIVNAHVTVDKPVFNTSELFSYMTYNEYIITPLDEDPVSYFDMGTQESETVLEDFLSKKN